MPEDLPPLLHAVIRDLRANEESARTGFSMVPSESSTSPLCRIPYMLDAAGRYYFQAPDGEAPFRSAELAARIEEEVAIPLLEALGGAPHANLRPISGLNAMLVALSALGGEPGNTVVSISPEIGGHYATGSLVQRLGLRSELIGGPTPHDLDLDALAITLRRTRPRLLYLDQGHALFPYPVAPIAAVMAEASPETHLHVDVSHVLGLVLGGALPNPLAAGAGSYGGSTHKTFPGPQKGVLLTGSRATRDAFAAAQFFIISSHHLGGVLSLALALVEFASCDGAAYAKRLPLVARRFAHGLAEHRLEPEAAERGYSACHQLWIRTAPKGIPAQTASDRLAAAGFRVNVLPDLPGIGEPALRIGLSEITYLGVGDDDVDELARLFAQAALGHDTATIAAEVREIRLGCRSPYQVDAPAVHEAMVALLADAVAGHASAAVRVGLS